MKTKAQAIKKAEKVAKRTGETIYVLYVPWDDLYGPYTYTDIDGLSTFWHDTQSKDIVWMSE